MFCFRRGARRRVVAPARDMVVGAIEDLKLGQPVAGTHEHPRGPFVGCQVRCGVVGYLGTLVGLSSSATAAAIARPGCGCGGRRFRGALRLPPPEILRRSARQRGLPDRVGGENQRSSSAHGGGAGNA